MTAASLTAADCSDPFADHDWARIGADLETQGYALMPGLLPPADCDALIADYPRDPLYRSTVAMARHGFGAGEYRYFAYPLPDRVSALRAGLYPHLAPIANGWRVRLGQAGAYPPAHAEFAAACRAAGQRRPTPLILKYGPGDYNRLHQDLYGALHFPLQAAILLSEPGVDFTGGAFVLTEQRPRMQSRAEVVPLRKGDAVVFAVNERPVHGTRGDYRVKLRHGVSTLRSGARFTLGIIFHDAV